MMTPACNEVADISQPSLIATISTPAVLPLGDSARSLSSHVKCSYFEVRQLHHLLYMLGRATNPLRPAKGSHGEKRELLV